LIQHHDANMSDAFFRDLRLPEPAHHLEVGSGSHAEQTGRTMIAYEAVCQRERPAAIVVVGDVNATAACALVGVKLWIPVVHLEAGLRSRDRHMPEEIKGRPPELWDGHTAERAAESLRRHLGASSPGG
jgi:UDP-N-acetylglucosamine 2-epimerase (non-hydrolysing)